MRVACGILVRGSWYFMQTCRLWFESDGSRWTVASGKRRQLIYDCNRWRLRTDIGSFKALTDSPSAFIDSRALCLHGSASNAEIRGKTLYAKVGYQTCQCIDAHPLGKLLSSMLKGPTNSWIRWRMGLQMLVKEEIFMNRDIILQMLVKARYSYHPS
jgi:hypothetical protein